MNILYSSEECKYSSWNYNNDILIIRNKYKNNVYYGDYQFIFNVININMNMNILNNCERNSIIRNNTRNINININDKLNFIGKKIGEIIWNKTHLGSYVFDEKHKRIFCNLEWDNNYKDILKKLDKNHYIFKDEILDNLSYEDIKEFINNDYTFSNINNEFKNFILDYAELAYKYNVLCNAFIPNYDDIIENIEFLEYENYGNNNFGLIALTNKMIYNIHICTS